MEVPVVFLFQHFNNVCEDRFDDFKVLYNWEDRLFQLNTANLKSFLVNTSQLFARVSTRIFMTYSLANDLKLDSLYFSFKGFLFFL